MPFGWFKRPETGPSSSSQIPVGNVGRSFVGNTFSFHDNAQAVVLDALRSDPSAQIIRARVLNRDIGLVIDHDLARTVLSTGSMSGECPRFSHRAAYKQLIAAFFAEPNILLEDEDEPDRQTHRDQWERHMDEFTANIDLEAMLGGILRHHGQRWSQGEPFDLYTACKDLSHELVFKIFLGIETADKEIYGPAVEATNTSLRGQFSLPVTLGGYVQTTYSMGLRAQADFQDIVSDRVDSGECPFLHGAKELPEASVVTHVSTFASSLVIKALASYLCFVTIQRTRYDGPNLPLLLETERLCPPIIGVLRQVLDGAWQATPTMHVPENWDTWLYFPMINRDTRVYGEDAREFKPSRWESSPSPPEPLTLGQGSKRCLGQGLVRRLVGLVLDEMKDVQVDIVSDLDASVRDYLGWEDDGVHKWQGIKQLPVQRPKVPVMVRCSER